MAKVITLTGLGNKKRLAGKNRCTPVRVFSRVEDKELIVCKEDIKEDNIESIGGLEEVPVAETAPLVNVPSVSPRRRGRPRGSSPLNPNYSTKKGRRAKAPSATFCPRENRQWVMATVGGGVKAKRCRCNAPGNSRFLKNSDCE